MIGIKVTVSPNARTITVDVDAALENRAKLNQRLGTRLAEEMQDHFRQKNRVPNKMGAPRTNFWNQVAEDTRLASFNNAGAVVTVANENFHIHLKGGTILPKPPRKALTIPMIPTARGLFVASYERKFGRKLFTIPDVPILFERVGAGGDQSLTGETKARTRSKGKPKSIRLAARTQLRAVYRLAPKAKIDADPDALPSPESIQAALTEEAGDYLKQAI